jgi:hypothetical protein
MVCLAPSCLANHLAAFIAWSKLAAVTMCLSETREVEFDLQEWANGLSEEETGAWRQRHRKHSGYELEEVPIDGYTKIGPPWSRSELVAYAFRLETLEMVSQQEVLASKVGAGSQGLPAFCRVAPLSEDECRLANAVLQESLSAITIRGENCGNLKCPHLTTC